MQKNKKSDFLSYFCEYYDLTNPKGEIPNSSLQGARFFEKFYSRSGYRCWGLYTYYDDPSGVENFEKNVLYRSPIIKSKLIIGKFCAIATGVKFIMNAANHKADGFSSYPFGMFGGDRMESLQKSRKGSGNQNFFEFLQGKHKGDTIIGNDVRIGYNVTILPGVKIGNGAIIGENATVTKDVEPYSIVGGNPAKCIRYRFEEETIALLEKIQWRDWDINKITENLDAIVGNDIQKLKNLV